MIVANSIEINVSADRWVSLHLLTAVIHISTLVVVVVMTGSREDLWRQQQQLDK